MSDVSVDKGVPIPQSVSGPGSSRYPLSEMGVGDSFAFPLVKQANVRSAIALYVKGNPGKKFTTRTVGDEIRVWRVE